MFKARPCYSDVTLKQLKCQIRHREAYSKILEKNNFAHNYRKTWYPSLQTPNREKSRPCQNLNRRNLKNQINVKNLERTEITNPRELTKPSTLHPQVSNLFSQFQRQTQSISNHYLKIFFSRIYFEEFIFEKPIIKTVKINSSG